MRPLAPSDDDWFSWRWIAGAAAGGILIGGLFVARSAEGGALYFFGLAASCAAALAIYALIATAYGPAQLGPVGRLDPMPANGAVRWAVGGISGGIALWALFAAREGSGLVYEGGLGLFGVAVLYDFLLIKDWFDRQKNARA